ncbi:MAG: DUF3368 domain-containing protein [Methylophaga sp.]|nr:DUF3368 domain-containing protein [Methylophaga sp.]
MLLLISDANILIDLEEGQLIEMLFELPYQFSIPDILFAEELEQQHEYLLELGLTTQELTSQSMMQAVTLTQQYTNPSRNDCFALALAQQENCPLVTGDKALRAAAATEGVVVKGTLWIIEQMVRQGLITTAEARDAYQNMKAANRRLPWDIAEATLRDIEAGN